MACEGNGRVGTRAPFPSQAPWRRLLRRWLWELGVPRRGADPPRGGLGGRDAEVGGCWEKGAGRSPRMGTGVSGRRCGVLGTRLKEEKPQSALLHTHRFFSAIRSFSAHIC